MTRMYSTNKEKAYKAIVCSAIQKLYFSNASYRLSSDLNTTKIYKPNPVSSIVFLLLVLNLLTGCVAVQPFPVAARAGDTITLAVGSPDGMTTSNTTVVYVPDSDPLNPIDITSNIRAITKIYPDKTSTAWLGKVGVYSDAIPSASGHGGWQSVIVLDLPSSLPVGQGKIEVSTGAGVTYPASSKTVNGVEVNMEILAGPGQSNPFSYFPYSWSTSPIPGDLSLLEPGTQALIKMPSPQGSGGGQYGAIQIKVNAPTTDGSGGSVSTGSIRVVSDDQPTNLISQRQTSWIRDGDLFTVNIVSPNAKLTYPEARFSIVLKGNGLFTGTPVIESVIYYDADGYVTTGPIPTVLVIQ